MMFKNRSLRRHRLNAKGNYFIPCLGSLAFVLLLTSCSESRAPSAEAPGDKASQPAASFMQVLDAYYEDGLKLNPINATFYGDNRYNDQFPNFLSETHRAQQKTYYSNYLDKMQAFNDGELSGSERLSKAILMWDANIALEGLSFRQDLHPIDQMWTDNLVMGQFASGQSAQPFNTVKDYQDWLKRVDAYLLWLKTAKEKMQEGIGVGHVLPKSLVVKIIPQMETLATTPLQEHLYYSPVRQFPDSITEPDQKTLADAYASMVTDKLMPAHAAFTEFLTSEYLPAARDSSGIQGIPNGEAFYTYQIKRFTTTTMSAAAIHDLGLSEVARIRQEMESVKEAVGFEGDLKAFFDYVRNKPELMPYTDPQQVIGHFYAIYERVKPKVAELFNQEPTIRFEIRRTETFREQSASAEYNPGSLDGTRPGIFYVPIPAVTEYNIFSDESLFLHEAIPGHHYQVSLAMENTQLPQFRKLLYYSGYGEGWALYTESLGKELGLYADPYQYFGMLSAEMHRAIRLVVDTGLHSKGWTREQAIQYSLDNEAESEASIISEVERYMANPGQALAYKIGQLKIRELRKRARDSLGDSFDIGDFHHQLLESGAMPLAILEDKIDRWIESNK
jgi:uncharacterized protein (DUF885 family)